MNEELTIGIVGAGGFAGFAAKAFQKVKGIGIAGVADINVAAANQLAQDLQAQAYPDYEQLLRNESINLVYIATPPYLHYRQSKLALEAGKHVICEKPAALETHEAEELASLAKSRQLLYTVNLMQRYNPLYAIVGTIISEKWLGDFVHGFFENYASDEKLGPDHWFWDEKLSGGIFIEHGVHFFDMFNGWFGKGNLVHSMELIRPGLTQHIVDRVQATILYNGSPVTFYHGFNQPKILDRQEMRLQFDHGDITLYEWVPVKIRIHGLLENENLEKLITIFPNCTIQYHTRHSTEKVKVRGKFNDILYNSLITLEDGDNADKMPMYEQLIISMIKDQWLGINDPLHKRIIDHNNAVESLRLAKIASSEAIRL